VRHRRCGESRRQQLPPNLRLLTGMGRIQPGVLAKPADRSIKRMVQPREQMPDRYCWKSPVGGQTHCKVGYTPTH
jgi:hypothetical protein